LPSAEWLPAIRGWRVARNDLAILQDMGFEVPPELIPKFRIDGFKTDLYPFQIEGVKSALRRNRILIADEMGLGKTPQALAFLQARKDLRPAVIVCPASLKLNWIQEINKFLGDTPENITSILSGKKPESVSAATPIQIINYDVLDAWLPVLKPKVVIGDEAHYIKNGKSARSKAFKKLCRGAEMVMLLTGTPVMNRPIELFYLVNMLAPHEFSDYISFGKRYCAGHEKQIVIRGGDKKMIWDFSGQSNLQELNTKLKRSVMIRRLKKDVLDDLPPLRYASVPVELSNPEAYLEAERNFIRWLRGEITEGTYSSEKLVAARKAQAMTKIEYLKQIAAMGKLDAAIEWVKDFLESGEKLVLFVHHRSVGNAIVNAFPGCAVLSGATKEKDRMPNVNRFQTNPECRLFVGSIQAAGVGLTLTAASNVAVLEYPWRPADMIQAVSRCHRIGQKSSVTAWCLVAKVEGTETIDEKILKTLRDKVSMVDAIVDGTADTDKGILDDVLDDLMQKEILD
jgi:SNF2 family DNA or RNA helicase